MKIAGLDIGTTGCKCTVFDENGKYLDKAYRDYPVKRTVGGHEIDISAVMDGVDGTARSPTEIKDLRGFIAHVRVKCVVFDRVYLIPVPIVTPIYLFRVLADSQL